MRFAPDVNLAEKRTDIIKNDDLVMGTASRSFELESWSYIQHKDYQLHVLHKKEFVSNRRLIPATETHRLDFMRMYTTALFKVEIITTQQINVTTYLKGMILACVFEVIPQYYMIMFLSSYCPEEHMYVSKMVPLMWGTKLLIILSSFLQLQANTDILALILDYLLSALIYQNPWNKCDEVYKKSFIVPFKVDKNIHCFSPLKFKNLMNSGNITQHSFYFIKKYATTSVSFWSSTMQYFYANKNTFFTTTEFEVMTFIYRLVIWLGAFMYSYLIYKKLFWKILHRFHWMLLGLYFFTLVMSSLEFLEKKVPYIRPLAEPVPDVVLKLDFSSLGWATLSPPALHILYSRKQLQINPGWDSAILVASSAFYTFALAFTDTKVKTSVDSDIGFHYVLKPYNAYGTFFYYPMYFSKLYMGDIFTLFFFVIVFVSEFSSFTFVLFCLTEVIMCEWPVKGTKRWMLMIPLLIAFVAGYLFTHFYTRLMLYIYSDLMSAMAEVASIAIFYPINRFIDDITFHFGAAPTKLREYTLYIFPIHYFYKTYEFIVSLEHAYNHPNFQADFMIYFQEYTKETWIISIVPLVIGIIYAFIKYVVKGRKFGSVVKPIPKWGPPDHVTRQLRKQYDSREYVPSQSSRYLSRHLLAKAEAGTYKLDIRYESAAAHARRSTFKFEQDYSKDEDNDRVPRIQRRHSSDENASFFNFDRK